jgi:hypothetical protein
MALSLDDIKKTADEARQHSYEMLTFNIKQAEDGVTIDSYAKVVNNTVNKPDKIVATQ